MLSIIFCLQKEISWGDILLSLIFLPAKHIVLSFIFSIRLTELANETLGIKVPPLFLAATGLTELANETPRN